MGKEQDLLEAARTGNVALVEKLLSGKKGLLGSSSGSIPLPGLLSMWRGPNVNCADGSGYTPLHHAALNGHRDVVLKLLQFEASTNMADTKGCFPLHLAAWRGDVDIVRILIHHGPSHCRVNEQNHEKETALHCAARYGHSDVVGVLLQELSDAGMRNRRGETPLDLAALYGRLQVVRMLLSARPGSTGTGAQPHTPLHLAARNGHHATVQTLLDAGMDVNSRTEKGSALHEASLYGKMDVVRLLLNSGIDVNIKDCQGKTALEILKEHPAQKSQQITALIQEFMMAESERSRVTEEPARQCPVPAPRNSVSSPAASPSLRHKNDTVTGELSKLLSEIKMCRDRDYSFEELCQTISSHSHSVESFSSGRLSDEERCGTLARTAKRPSPPLPIAMEEEKVCGPSGLWEALTPCNGCRNLGFTQDSRHCGGNAQSPSLDVFSPQDEDNPYELVATAVTRKPCSLDIHLLNACQRNGHSPNVPVSDAEQRNHGDDYTGLTPDCSPPSPDTALKNIERVIRPQPKQRTSLSSSQEAQRTAPNHSGEPSEVSSSLGYASFSTSPPASPPASPPVSPADCSTGSAEDYTLNNEVVEQRDNAVLRDQRRDSHIPEQFAGLLHGSSPACESPDNPYQLYGRVRNLPAPEPPHRHGNLLRAPDPAGPFPRTDVPAPREAKPQVVYRTVFHTRVNQNRTGAPAGRGEGDPAGTCAGPREVRGGGVGPCAPPLAEERACTLGRMRSAPRVAQDLRFSRNFSKSDSDLVAASPGDEDQWNMRGQGSPGRGSPTRLERTPSFTAEWEEIDKIMSSIGAGIGTELEDNKEVPSERRVSMAGSFDSHFARNMMWQCQLSQPDCRCYRVDGYSLLKRLPLHPLIGPRCPAQSVGQWLDSIGLVQYENHLLANGFDNVQFMGSNVVEDQDLLEIGILNSAHRQRLLQAIRLLPRVRPIGYDGNNPTSVAEWLESLELGDYTKSFLINGYTSMELVKKIWEIELINVLKIGLIGHRKRILASLGDRLHEDPPQKPPRAISLRDPTGNHTPPQLSPSLSQAPYPNASSLDVQHLIMQADARRRRNDSYFEDVPRSKLERQMAQVSMQGEWCEPITLRPPNEATSSTPVQYWQHHPEKLIFQSCDYEAYYLGSMLVKELRGTESTQDACAKMRKSTEQMKKVPTIVLSVSYKGVKFIDATNKNIIAEHEIRNISCAAQDPEDLSTFAYITKDLKSSHHYCHVFTAFDVNLAYEIILTLGQAFEVAYQLALQARKGGHGSSTLPESFDSKPSKPIPKPRSNIRKSMEQPSMDQKGHGNVPWIVEPGQEAKRGVNTKAVPDAHVYYCGNQRM
ncbi:ankyrin repeat and sterile alpha motif domain-containing protein 1B isoform X3 [Electrophorus electricus]|uniref:ankyrin repeat and sterile alpha motif domain-containing protein 1B isoform X3 n=1 Tax=Electrophorus electricus TaxID=8005 RepID=UPI0015CFE6AD|nr:ankyrin repeat and sterile alpha motif domain-containing protein 1B isoform X3 [Electrophorus electricus]